MPVYAADFNSWWYDAMYDGDILEYHPENGDTLTRYFIEVNQNLPSLLQRYGTEMVANGLQYIYKWYSYLRYVQSKQWRGERTILFYNSMKELYGNGLNRYCYYSFDQKCHPLNNFCCNLWYFGPGEYFYYNDATIMECSLDVLQYALKQKNPACQRSALQGLGMLLYYNQDNELQSAIHESLNEFINRDIYPKARKRAQRLLQ